MPKLRDQHIFVYKATTLKGTITGEIMAKNLSMAKTLLKKQGIEVTTIKPRSGGSSYSGSITSEDIALFSRQMATMQSSGIALVQALNVIIDGAEKVKFRNMVKGLREEVEAGKSFAMALGKYPNVFDELFCNLVAAGEQSGSLDVMLARIAVYKEKTESIKNKVKKALYYPIAVLCVSFIVSGVLLLKVVPTFKKLFDGFGSKLPDFTLMVLSLSDFVKLNGVWILGGIVGGTLILLQGYRTNLGFKHLVQRLLLKVPILGVIIHKAAIARFARTLATTFAAGVPLNEALITVAKASGNIVYQQAIMRIKDLISNGQNLQLAMQSTGIFPIMVVQMIAIGEESGKLEQMLEKVASMFEEEVASKVDGLTSLLEPIIMVILGGLVGSLVIAMYLPIFKMGSVI